MRIQDLEGWEVSFIKAMQVSGRWGNQDIQSAFSTPTRNFCSSRLSKTVWPLIGNRPEPAASPDSLARFEAQIAGFGRDQTLQLYRGSRPVFQVDHHFLPVGQGLFAAGQVRIPGANPFRWVYDCGTHDAQSLIDPALDQCPGLPPQGQPKGRIDLLALSHFDQDHISGVVRLLGRAQVRWCLLPYLAPWERLVLLADASGLATDFGQFLLNPAGFLRDRGVEHVILVPPGAEPMEPPAGERPDPRDPPPFLKLEGPRDTPPSAHVQVGDAQLRDDPWVLPPGGGLSLLGLWEFVPYVDPAFRLAFGAVFRDKAAALATAFLAAPGDAALKDLKDWYAIHIAALPGQTTGATANNISLHLYAGPLGRIEASPMVVTARPGMEAALRTFQQAGPDPWRIGVLLTGDADLRHNMGFQRFQGFFQPHGRLARSGVFQVPHHGSKHNWSPGQAALLGPRLSVFSSGESGFATPVKRPGHPHPAIWQEFGPFTPARVNASGPCHASALFTPVAV